MTRFRTGIGITRPSRRHFLAGAAAGLAAQPARAMRITRPTGLTIGSVEVPLWYGKIPAYRAQPTVFDSSPILLLVEGEDGFGERLQEMCRRFAAKGYFAVAPDLYSKEADPASFDDPAERAALMNLEPDSRINTALDATIDWAITTGGDATRCSVLGWGRGGRSALLYAAHRRYLKAVIALYAPLSGRKTENQPASPIDVAGQIAAPVLMLYGSADAATPPADINKLQDGLRAAAVENKFFGYPDATTGFDVEDGPNYDPAASDDAFARCLAWLRSHAM